jgi:hypothetical protein
MKKYLTNQFYYKKIDIINMIIIIITSKMEHIHNDNNNNSNDDDINIRLPDNTYNDRLIDQDIDIDIDIDYNLERVIQESIQDCYRVENAFINEIDNVLDNERDIIFEENKKKNILPNFKSKMLRLIHFDKNLKEMWNKLYPILDLYENNKIIHHIMNTDTYNQIFNLIKTVRIPLDEWVLLETIFIKELK